MEKIERYSKAIQDLLTEYALPPFKTETILVADTNNHHYQVLRNGWVERDSYVLRVVLYFRIKPTGKIWIMENTTEDDVAEALIKRGVEKMDIVLGFLPEYVRQYSEYAVA
jgi:hypothetical protein